MVPEKRRYITELYGRLYKKASFSNTEIKNL